MAVKKTRSIKVNEFSRLYYDPVPMLTLRGKWLASFGFKFGDQVNIECEEGKLTIMAPGYEKKEPLPCVAEAETEYGKGEA